MMRVRNRARWSMFDNYNYYDPFSPYAYNPYGSFGWSGIQPGFSLGLGYGYGSFYNPWSWGYSPYNHFNNYWNWNNYYNPYYGNIIVVNPKNKSGRLYHTKEFQP